MHAQVAPDDNRLLRSIPATRVALIERIANAVGPAGKRSGASKAQVELQQRFTRAYFRGVGEEDLAERTAGVLARALTRSATRFPRTVARLLSVGPTRRRPTFSPEIP